MISMETKIGRVRTERKENGVIKVYLETGGKETLIAKAEPTSRGTRIQYPDQSIGTGLTGLANVIIESVKNQIQEEDRPVYFKEEEKKEPVNADSYRKPPLKAYCEYLAESLLLKSELRDDHSNYKELHAALAEKLYESNQLIDQKAVRKIFWEFTKDVTGETDVEEHIGAKEEPKKTVEEVLDELIARYPQYEDQLKQAHYAYTMPLTKFSLDEAYYRLNELGIDPDIDDYDFWADEIADRLFDSESLINGDEAEAITEDYIRRRMTDPEKDEHLNLMAKNYPNRNMLFYLDTTSEGLRKLAKFLCERHSEEDESLIELVYDQLYDKQCDNICYISVKELEALYDECKEWLEEQSEKTETKGKEENLDQELSACIDRLMGDLRDILLPAAGNKQQTVEDPRVFLSTLLEKDETVVGFGTDRLFDTCYCIYKEGDRPETAMERTLNRLLKADVSKENIQKILGAVCYRGFQEQHLDLGMNCFIPN